MIHLDTLYDVIKMLDEADTYDNTYDAGVCFSHYTDNDPIDLCMTAIQKRIDPIKLNGREVIADVAGFVKEHMQLMYTVSQSFRLSMDSADPNNEEDVYYGVELVMALEPGNGSDDDYLYILHELEPEIFNKYIEKNWEKWAEEYHSYFDCMLPEFLALPEIAPRIKAWKEAHHEE